MISCLRPSVILLFTVSVALAQPEPETSEPPANSRVPLVRVWTLVPGEVPPVEFGAFPKFKGALTLAADRGEGVDREVIATLKPFTLGDFVPVQPGNITFKLERQVGENRVVEAETSLSLRRGQRQTLIVTRTPTGALTLAELPATENPTNAGPTPTPKRIQLFCSPADAEILIEIPEIRFQRKLSSGETAELRNLPAAAINILVSGTIAGKPIRGESEIDLASEDSFSWLLIEDRYGRVVPVVTSDLFNE